MVSDHAPLRGELMAIDANWLMENWLAEPNQLFP
jgi:hypothetical protein